MARSSPVRSKTRSTAGSASTIPAIDYGQEVTDIQLWFENGKVVKETASKNEELLTSLLNTDAGARTLGELGIGTNYGIPRFTKNMLFDEKMGGTIHLAVGAGYPESGGEERIRPALGYALRYERRRDTCRRRPVLPERETGCVGREGVPRLHFDKTKRIKCTGQPVTGAGRG